jgi:hypothetical protein
MQTILMVRMVVDMTFVWLAHAELNFVTLEGCSQ